MSDTFSVIIDVLSCSL